MRKILSYITVFTIIFLSINSCDKIEEPFFEEGSSVWNGRKVLIYDFTGHKCGNCPRAHRLLETFKNTYGEGVVSVAIHATFFAMPDNNPDGKFAYDFRTDIGDILGGRDFSIDGYYGELNLPIGLVNNLSPGALKADSEWAEEVEKYISTYPEFEIRINNSYCSLNDNIITSINIETLIAGNRNLTLNVLIVEDGIIEWQTDYDYSQDPSYVENYIHDNVLRGGFTGAFGENINQNNNIIGLGTVFEKVYETKIGEDWVRNNCSVIAFVYDTDTQEVLQVEIEKFP